MKLSLILPTYNEKENIKRLIPKIYETLDYINFEILVMDDSSFDGTIQVIKNFTKKYKNLKIIVRKKREGIGAAVKHGFDISDGEILVSMDVDSLEPKDIKLLIDKINQGYDLVTGSRYIRGGFYQKKYFRTIIKNFVSKLGNKFAKFCLNIPINDFSLNFRAIKKKVWDKLKVKEKRNSFFIEIIVKAHFSGYKVGEVPIIFNDREYDKSKMKLFRETIKFFLKTMQYTINYRIIAKQCTKQNKK